MKQTTLATCVVLTGWIAVTTAQRTSEPPNPRTPEPANQPAHNVFVLTGCLERGDAPAAFRLTRASAIGQAPPRSNATPAAKDAKDDNAYELQATSSVSEQGLSREQLQTDVGQRVEVTIRPIETTASAAPLTTSSPAGEKKPAESPRPRYTVVKISRLGDSCA
jgi:hypothetical protein